MGWIRNLTVGQDPRLLIPRVHVACKIATLDLGSKSLFTLISKATRETWIAFLTWMQPSICITLEKIADNILIIHLCIKEVHSFSW